MTSRKLKKQMQQVATGITTYAAEEEAEIKESDVAIENLKSRHHKQPVQPTAA